jgi:adenylate cyclase
MPDALAMAAKLRVSPAIHPPFETTIGNTAAIGRARESHVCLHFSPQVSRQHAVLRCHNGYQYQIIDLGSRNGTFVNDRRVVLPVVLENGARIRIADNEIVFEEIPDESEQEHLDVTMATTSGLADVREVSLLVCDIRGFSSMSEILPSGDLAQVLGHWFRDAGNLIQGSGGAIDKFIGDAILSYWYETEPGPCEIALDIGKQLLEMARAMKWPDSQKPFRIAVALHYGSVTCGNVGLVAQRDATIIGDAVNTVFRLESIMKEMGEELVLSNDFAECLPSPGNLRDLGERMLKGKKKAVKIFGLPHEG